MALLVGQEEEGSAVAIAPAQEIPSAFKFTASKSGKVTALHVKFPANGVGTSGRLSLQEDEAGKPKEGVLCEGPIPSLASGEQTTTELNAEPEVVAGTVYWLTFLPLGGSGKIKPGTGPQRRTSTTKHTKISEYTAAQWGAAKEEGPASIWATGVESGTAAVFFPVTLPPTHFTPRTLFQPFIPGEPAPVTNIRTFEASLSLTGAVQKNVLNKVLTAALTSAGSLRQNVSKAFVASLSFAGSLGKNVLNKVLTAALTSAGLLGKVTAKGLTATVSFGGSLGKNVSKQLTAALSFVGKLLVKESGKFIQIFEASLSFAGSVNKSITKQLTAKLESSGTLGKVTAKGLTATVSFGGSLGKNVSKQLTAALTPAGTLGKNVKKQLAASLGPQGALGKKVTKAFAASLSFAGSLQEKLKQAGETIVVRFTAQLAFAGQLTARAIIFKRIKVTLVRAIERVTSAITQYTPPKTGKTVQGPGHKSTDAITSDEE